jgi:tetratricopeptide (TPR) repeat protein
MPLSPLEALEESQKNARLVLQSEPDNLLMLGQLGYIQKDLATLYYQTKNKLDGDEYLQAAEKAFRAVLTRDANDPSAHNGLGNVYTIRGDYDAAIDEYKAATSLAPKYTYSWFDMAQTLHQKMIVKGYSEDVLEKLVTAVITTLKLHVGEDEQEPTQKLPAEAFNALMAIKDWIVKLSETANK